METNRIISEMNTVGRGVTSPTISYQLLLAAKSRLGRPSSQICRYLTVTRKKKKCMIDLTYFNVKMLINVTLL